MSAPRPTADVVVHIRENSLYWAPEIRVSKLLPYLEAHGLPLYDALKALPEEERKACGIDLVKPRDGAS